MARTKDVVLAPEQKELVEKEYLDFVKPSTYGNKANPSSCNSLYDDVENPELRAIVEKVAATFYEHYDDILNFYTNRSSNAAAESFNAKIKAFRASLRGIVDEKFFLYRLAKIYAYPH